MGVVSKAMEDTVERTEGGQGTVSCHYCKLSPQSSVRLPNSHPCSSELYEGTALSQSFLALVPKAIAESHTTTITTTTITTTTTFLSSSFSPPQ